MGILGRFVGPTQNSYSADMVKEISDSIKWITRVPERIGAASELIHAYSKEDFKKIVDGYFGIEVCFGIELFCLR